MSKTTGDLAPEKQTMQKFRQEHDQYRHFLVTGDTKARLEQSAKYYSTERGTSGSEPSARNI